MSRSWIRNDVVVSRSHQQACASSVTLMHSTGMPTSCWNCALTLISFLLIVNLAVRTLEHKGDSGDIFVDVSCHSMVALQLRIERRERI